MAPVVAIDEDARQPIVGRARRRQFVLLAVMDVGQFVGPPVLAPGNGAVAIENNGGMCVALVHESLLERPVVLPGLRPQSLVAAEVVEPRAPAAAEDAVVSLDQGGVGVPARGTERFDT